MYIAIERSKHAIKYLDFPTSVESIKEIELGFVLKPHKNERPETLLVH